MVNWCPLSESESPVAAMKLPSGYNQGGSTLYDQPWPEAEIRADVLRHAWCFADDGSRMTRYAGHFRILTESAYGQNARIQQLKAIRTAEKIAETKRQVGLLPKVRR